MLPGKKFGNLVRRHRRAEQVTLHLVAAQLQEQRRLLFGFDTLRNTLSLSECAREITDLTIARLSLLSVIPTRSCDRS